MKSSIKLLSTLIIAATCNLQAAPLMQEDFFYSGTQANRPPIQDYEGWNIYFSGDGSSPTQSGFTANTPTASVAEAQSSTGAFDEGTPGVAYFYYGAANQARSFFMTHTLADPVAQNTPSLAFDWWYGTQSTNGQVRLAVEIGGNWYVGTDAFSSTTATATAQMETQGQRATEAFDTSAENWADFSFTQGSSFDVFNSVLPRETALPSGDITAFGFYSYNPNDGGFEGTSIDSVQVIPEPGTLALVAIALGCLLFFRRK